MPESEFLNYCGLRQKHSAVIDKLEFAKTLKFDDDRKVIYQVTGPRLRGPVDRARMKLRLALNE